MKHESKILPRAAHSLNSILESADKLSAIKKSDLHVGDRVYVKTLNSCYALDVLGNGKYRVSGGWFDHKGLSPATVTVAGCTWGGSVIKVDVVAACGLSVEFGNRLITSSIQKIFLLPYGALN
ncbi:MAG: hypothetical protein ACRDGA_03225 [Bacteroidota bacterium]